MTGSRCNQVSASGASGLAIVVDYSLNYVGLMIGDVRQHLRAAPFEPFTIVPSSGRWYHGHALMRTMIGIVSMGCVAGVELQAAAPRRPDGAAEPTEASTSVPDLVISVAPDKSELAAEWGQRRVNWIVDPLDCPIEFANEHGDREAILRTVHAAISWNGSAAMAEFWYWHSRHHFPVEVTISRYPGRQSLDKRWSELSAKFETRPVIRALGESAAWLQTPRPGADGQRFMQIRILVFRHGLFTGWVEGAAELGEQPLLQLAEAIAEKMSEVTKPHVLQLGDSVYHVERESAVIRPRMEFVRWGPEAVFRVSNPGDRAVLVWNVRKQVAAVSSGQTTWVTRESDYPGRGWSDVVVQAGQSAEFPMAHDGEGDWHLRLLYSRQISTAQSTGESFDGTYELIGPTLQNVMTKDTQPAMSRNAG